MSEMTENIREMAIIRISRADSKPGDYINTKPMVVPGEFWPTDCLKIPSGFKEKDEMMVQEIFHNDNGNLVCIAHVICWHHKKEDTYEFLQLRHGEFRATKA